MFTVQRRLFIHASFLAVIAISACGTPNSGEDRSRKQEFSATAHSVEGETAAGTRSRVGTVAADPDVLPLGTRIRVEHAGKYSGEYVVEDTGPAINGHEIDIYMKTDAEAKAFGRRRVQVIVLDSPDR